MCSESLKDWLLNVSIIIDSCFHGIVACSTSYMYIPYML